MLNTDPFNYQNTSNMLLNHKINAFEPLITRINKEYRENER